MTDAERTSRPRASSAGSGASVTSGSRSSARDILRVAVSGLHCPAPGRHLSPRRGIFFEAPERREEHMASVNKVILIGNLGKDPELRTTPQGTSLARFSVATTTTWKDASGAKQERTEWHDIVAWERLAQICGEYLHKGKMVYVEGSLQTRSWEDQNGQKRYKTEVKANNVVMLSPPPSRSDSARPAPVREESEAAEPASAIRSRSAATFAAISSSGRSGGGAARSRERRRWTKTSFRRDASARRGAGTSASARATHSGYSSSREHTSARSHPARIAAAARWGRAPNSASAPISRSSENATPSKPTRSRRSRVAVSGESEAGRRSLARAAWDTMIAAATSFKARKGARSRSSSRSSSERKGSARCVSRPARPSPGKCLRQPATPREWRPWRKFRAAAMIRSGSSAAVRSPRTLSPAPGSLRSTTGARSTRTPNRAHASAASSPARRARPAFAAP